MKNILFGIVAILFFLIRDLLILAFGIAYVVCWLLLLTPFVKASGLITWSVMGSHTSMEAFAFILFIVISMAMFCGLCMTELLKWKHEDLIDLKYGHLSESERVLNFEVWEDIRNIKAGW